MQKTTLNIVMSIFFSIVLAGVLLVFSVMQAGIGHGSYSQMMASFPYAVLAMFAADALHLPDLALLIALVLAIGQFVLYGFLVGKWMNVKKLSMPAIVLFSIHFVIVAAVFIFL